jgi:tripartite-type tricarboxylate transporter receptor subunit TctC
MINSVEEPMSMRCWTLACAIAGAVVTQAVVAQAPAPVARAVGAYPTKVVRIVDAFPPGGGSDVVARLIAPKLTEAWGQQVIVENRGGANGIIGNEHVLRSPADGYTVLIATGSYAANPSLYKLPYDPINDITVLGQVAATIFLMVVHPSVPAKTVKELVALARAKPGAINFGSTGTGGSTHLVMEYFKMTADVNLTHIPYKGTGPAVSDLVGGQIQVMIAATAPVMPHVKSGRLRALAVTGSKRIAAMPELPTVIESGVPGYDVGSWYAFIGPKGLSKEIVAQWNAELGRVTQMPDIRERFANGGMEAVSGSPEQFFAILKRDIERWQRVVKQAGIKLSS